MRDPGARWWDFAREILVRCPRCAGRALVAPHPGDHRYAVDWLTAPHRLTCTGCGHVQEWRPRRWEPGTGDAYFTDGGPFLVPRLTGPDDPYFGHPLWLRHPCRGRVLWAYNTAHLDLLERYVAARHRERPERPGSQTLLERLPAWITSAAARDAVLAAIRAMRATT